VHGCIKVGEFRTWLFYFRHGCVKGKSLVTWLYFGQVICNVMLLYESHLQHDCVVSFMTSYGEVIYDYDCYFIRSL
jgi:hypothetical protein